MRPVSAQEEISAKIKEKLLKEKMSIRALARKLNCDHSVIVRKLKCETRFTVDDLDKISRVLKIKLLKM